VPRSGDVRLRGVLIALATLVVGLVVAVNVLPGSSPPASAPVARSGGPRVSVLTIVAGPGIAYDRTEYEVPAGIVQVHLSGLPGIGLKFADPRLRECRLFTGGPSVCMVKLARGRYAVFDGIRSHRAAGLEATIIAS
jgi:hypothetical protein